MQLYCSQFSGFSRKVRIIAHELSLPLDLVEVNPAEHRERIETLNPLGKIPILVEADGAALSDSPVICEFIDAVHGQNRFIPASGDARWSVLRGAAIADGILEAGMLYRAERARGDASSSAAAAQRQKVDAGLTWLERRPAGWRTGFDFSHIATLCALGWLQFRLADEAFLSGHPLTVQWFEHISLRPSVAQTAPERSLSP